MPVASLLAVLDLRWRFRWGLRGEPRILCTTKWRFVSLSSWLVHCEGFSCVLWAGDRALLQGSTLVTLFVFDCLCRVLGDAAATL